jgi:hypothetical protein
MQGTASSMEIMSHSAATIVTDNAVAMLAQAKPCRGDE